MSATFTITLDDKQLDVGVTITRLPGGIIQIAPARTGSASMSSWGSNELAIIERWRGFRPETGAPAFADRLRADGISITAPRTRTPGKDPEPYLRFTVKSATGQSLSGYINTLDLVLNSKRLVPALKDIPGGRLRSNGGELLFDVDDLDLCLKVVKAMQEV